MVFAMLLLAGTTLMAAQCAVDNCLRALIATQTPERRLASAQAFCANFTRAPAAANTSIPSYASEHCGGTSGPEASSRFVFLPNALTRVFQFGRPFALVSPVSIPVIQTFDEVKAIGDNVRIVSRINGVDASEFVQNPVDQASSSRDLDTAYNWIFNSKHNVPYPGENTTVENTTGKLSSAANFASIQVPFVNITDGESFYQTFCALGLSALPGGPPASTATSKRKIVQFGLYPEPVVKSYDGTISGYLLDDEGLKDVAILNVASFSTRSSKIFQKTKIIHLRTNVGGCIFQGHDLFRRFFPYIEQGALTHRRENDHFLTIAKGIFTAEENMVPSDGDWRSLSQRANYRDPYTAFIREDLNNSYTAADNFGIDIAGYGCRQIYTQFFESRHHPLDRRLLCLDMFRFFVRDENSANIKTIAMAVGPKADSCKAIPKSLGDRFTNLSSKQKASLLQLTRLPLLHTMGATLNVCDQDLRDNIGIGIPAHFVNEPVDCGLYWTLTRNGGGCVAETGFGEARPGVQPPSKAAEAATRPQTKVMSAADDGLDRNHLD
ncbi:hypothetical protein CSPAE12_01659 [Colletotrichum incanum]|nr:hypothetical protein CSPAE12_01659 [Colletotrichum incanum]